MISLTINHQIELSRDRLPEQLERFIAQDLTLDNPKYLNAVKRGYSANSIPSTIRIYEYSKDYKKLLLPRGYLFRLIWLLRKTRQQYEVDDQRFTLPPVEFNSKIKLREYQEPAVNYLLKFGHGGLVGGCGSGKTEMMLDTMARIQQPSLWITHTGELKDQVIGRACKCFEGMKEKEIGVIAEGKVSIGDRLTVALVQTLRKINLEDIKYKFGSVFVDEGHHIAAETFLNPISQFPAKYRVWASATPDREDGLTKMVIAAGGPILYSVDPKDLPTITPELQIIETEHIGKSDPEDYPGMMLELITDEQRNQLIVDTVREETEGHYCLILSDRIEHLEILKNMLDEQMPEKINEILIGKMKKKDREAVMERARRKEVDILLSTQLAREGLDLPHLDRLFLVTPKKASGAVQQEAGRIMRPCDGKTDAVVFDFWDVKNPIFKTQFWKRKKVYQNLGIRVDMKNGIRRIAQ